MSSAVGEVVFGRIRIDPVRRGLWVGGEPAKLGARAFDVLTALIQRRDRIITKSELLEQVWPNLVVEENNLQVQIHALRKVLGPDVIVTVPGRGYRFAAPLHGTATPALPPAAAAPRPVVAAPVSSLPPTNLRAEQLQMYGRDDDVEVISALLRAHRQASIVGAGGIGKSRLGLALAHALRAEHRDGVWLIELAPLTDPALLPASVAQALGIHLQGRRPPLEELVGALDGKRLLLLLDNCEHVLEQAGALVQAVISHTRDVFVLVTSQEPLRVAGEHLYRLGTLAVPPDDETPIVQQALAYAAVRLFVERVQSVRLRFGLTPDNVAAVVDICRRLDGLPLPIELAAAREPLLGVQGIKQRLGERLHILTGGPRTALRRHQTLRGALDWSHGLLSADEQAVFRRLGVFSGSFAIEAAQQVASDSQTDEWDVLDHVASIADKSLIGVEGQDPPRYRLLESARVYALERLAAAGEEAVLARRHALYFSAFFKERADALFAGALTEDALIAARVLDLDNVRAALAWSLADDGDNDVALSLLANAWPLWAASVPESERWLLALLRRLGDGPLPKERRAWLEYVQIMWKLMSARWAGGWAVDREDIAASTLRALGDERREAFSLCWLAFLYALHGDRQKARAAMAEAGRLEKPDWPSWLASCRLNHAVRVGYLVSEEYQSEMAALSAMLARLEAQGDGAGRAALVTRAHMGEECLLQRRYEDAAGLLLPLAELGRQQRRDDFRMCFTLGPLVLALVQLGRLEPAREVMLEAVPVMRRTGFNLMATPTDAGQGQFNLGWYSNPKFDELTTKVQSEADEKRRNEMIREAFKIHQDDIGHIPLHQQALAWGFAKKVRLVQMPDNRMFYKWISVKPDN